MSSLILTAVLFFNFCVYDLPCSVSPENNVIHLSITGMEDSTLATGWYHVEDMPNDYYRHLDKSDDKYNSYFVAPAPIITRTNIIKTDIYKDEDGMYSLVMKFDADGTKAWARATELSIGKTLVFILNDQLVEASIVHAEITGGVAQIKRKEYSEQDLQKFKKLIMAL